MRLTDVSASALLTGVPVLSFLFKDGGAKSVAGGPLAGGAGLPPATRY